MLTLEPSGPRRRCLAPILVSICLFSGVSCGPDRTDSAQDGAADTGDADLGGEGEVPVAPDLPLGRLVDPASLRETDTLAIVIEPERSGQVPGDFEDPVWQVGLRFTSQSFLSASWTHRGFLLVPGQVDPEARFAAIVEYGTDNGLRGISDGAAFLPQYGAVTADRLDIPVLLLDDVPPPVDLREEASLLPYRETYPQCFTSAIGNPQLYEDCLRSLSQASGRLEIYPALPIAVAYIRAVTVLEELATRLPTMDLGFEIDPFEVDRVAILAGGLDGIALRYSLALDDRVAGIMVAANVGDWRDFYEIQADRWSTDYAFGDPTSQIAFLDTSQGAEFLDTYDLSAISEVIAGRSYLLAIGTNTNLFPLDTLDSYLDLLPQDRSLLFVANYGDGFGSADHLLAWRVFLAHLLGSRSYAEVSATYQDDQGNLTVTARIEGTTLVGSAEVWYVQRHTEQDDDDFRDALWRSAPMQVDGDELVGWFTPLTEHSAFFVRVVDAESFYEGPLTSPVYLVIP